MPSPERPSVSRPQSWVNQLGQSAIDDEGARRIAEAIGADELICYVGQPSWTAELGTLLLTSGFGVGLLTISGVFAWKTAGAALGLEPFTFNDDPAPAWLAGAFLLLLLPLLSIGAVCAAAPVTGFWRSRQTLHVVTNRRIVTVTVGRLKETTSFPLSAISIHKRIDHGGGRGTLVLAHGVFRDPDGHPRPDTVTWFGVPNVAQAALAITHQGRGLRREFDPNA